MVCPRLSFALRKQKLACRRIVNQNSEQKTFVKLLPLCTILSGETGSRARKTSWDRLTPQASSALLSPPRLDHFSAQRPPVVLRHLPPKA